MEIILTNKADKNLLHWKTINNQAILERIRLLLESTIQEPYNGIGKPEPLQHELTGKWSRRKNREHRIIYEVLNDRIIIHSLHGHY